MTEFETGWWGYYNDRTAKERVLRVLDHYDADFWWVTQSLRFTTTNDEVVDYVELGLGSHGTVRQVSEFDGRGRYRVDFDA